MSKFLIYLFESGLCLTLFYSGYIIFFRKETYFTFNRVYLLASMVLALLLPLTNIQMSFNSDDGVGIALVRIGEFRHYYEDLILMTEPNFEIGDKLVNDELPAQSNAIVSGMESQKASFTLSSVLFYTYISGVLFFALRLLLLVFNLFRIVKKNKVIKQGVYSIVLINDDIPSFSFLRWIFINKEALQSEEFEQVLTHEKVHVQHKHSVDLLLAHIITIFQWFNPLTWRIQKSIKTCHEYIADRQVIDQGHALFDYQSLLLSQLISIRSVELVNNFNLLSIKKRIAMMNKIKSGRRAQLKALLVVPMLTLAFFFFANMTGKTLKVDAREMHNTVEPVISVSTLQPNQAEEAMAAPVAEPKVIEKAEHMPEKPNELAFLKGNHDVRLNTTAVAGNEMKKKQMGIDLPSARSVKVYNEAFVLSKLSLNKGGFYIDGEKAKLDNSLELFGKLKENAGADNRKSVLLEIDKAAKMSEVDKIKQALRFNDLLKIAYAAKANELSGLKESNTALLNLLPPKEAKMLTKEEAFFEGIKMFTISSPSASKLKNISRQLQNHIEDSKKYVILYEYNDQTTYDNYIQTLDMIYSTVWDLRKEYAFSTGINYDKMTKEQEKKLRKKYPLTLTMKNVDSDK